MSGAKFAMWLLVMHEIKLKAKCNKFTNSHTIISEHPKAIPDTMQKLCTTAICTADKAIVTTIIIC